MVAKFKDICLLKKKIYASYKMRPNMMSLCKKNSTMIIDLILLMPLQDSMVISMINLWSLLVNLNLLLEELLLEDAWEALLQNKFDKLEKDV